MPEKPGPRKGFFGRIGLPVAKSYVYPQGRNRPILLGLVGGTVALALLLVDISLDRNAWISGGPLSSNHASFENDCEACHTPFQAVSDEKCMVCHDKFGEELGVHTFDAHYVYRSADYTRAFQRDQEIPCFGCHSEHGGREAAITAVSDVNCLSCHDFDSFGSNHPQFDFVAESVPDDDSLIFTHIRHVKRIQEQEGIDDLERACLYCHNPRPNGTGFEALRFDLHCNSCHLGTRPKTRSANLQIKDPGPVIPVGKGKVSTLNLGVETLETIRNRQGPGEHWTLSTNPSEFRARGNRVMKTRLHHLDPWIMHNLRMLRRTLYPSAGLADLLKSSAKVAPGEIRVLYREALETLQQYSQGLHARSDQVMQKELEKIDQLLGSLKDEFKDDRAQLDDAPFQLSLRPTPELTPEQIQEINEFVETLVQPCKLCHQVPQATISRVQKDQATLNRAEFNHRAHIIESRCLDCHSDIPFLDYQAEMPEVGVDFDQAAIQNLPSIESCQECHTPAQASSGCSTCHRFHPSRIDESRLLPYVQ